jgi:hypothetical protein
MNQIQIQQKQQPQAVSPDAFGELESYTSDLDIIRHCYTQFLSAMSAHEKKRALLFDNLDMYYGRQISNDVLNKMRDSKREPVVYNLLYRKVSGLVGSVLKQGFDISYTPYDGKRSSLTLALQDMLNSDQELGDWEWELMRLLTYGSIFQGVMQMRITDKFSPMGNIAFETTTPGTVILDPNWVSDNSWDIQSRWKFTSLTPRQIMNIYEAKTDEVKNAVLLQLKGQAYDASNLNFNKEFSNKLGQTYRVIEYAYMVPVPSIKEIDVSQNITLPETDEDRKSVV